MQKFIYIERLLLDQASVLADSIVSQDLAQQSQLLTNRMIFIIFAISLLCIAGLIFVIPLISKTYMFYKKRMTQSLKIYSYRLKT